MNKDQCLKLIQLYSSFRYLWDPSSEDYLNKKLRESAWETISKEMNVSVTDLKSKMESLMGSYRREKSRERKSRIAGHPDIYTSKWYAFGAFKFMAHKNYATTLQDSFQIEDICNTVMQDDEDEQASMDIYENNDNFIVVEGKECKPRKKRLKKGPKQDQGPIPYCPIQKCPNEEDSEMLYLPEEKGGRSNETEELNQKDTCSAFGEYIAEELRKYDSCTQARLKYSICRLIYEADTAPGTLT